MTQTEMAKEWICPVCQASNLLRAVTCLSCSCSSLELLDGQPITITLYLDQIKERGQRLAQKQRMINDFDGRERQRWAKPAVRLPSRRTAIGLWDGIGAGGVTGAIVCLVMGWEVGTLGASLLALVWAISVKLRDVKQQKKNEQTEEAESCTSRGAE